MQVPVFLCAACTSNLKTLLAQYAPHSNCFQCKLRILRYCTQPLLLDIWSYVVRDWLGEVKVAGGHRKLGMQMHALTIAACNRRLRGDGSQNKIL